MPPRLAAAVALPLLVGALAACERLPEFADAATALDDSLALAAEPPEDRTADYRLVLTGFHPDTLAGRARFGTVVDGPTGDTMAVVRLDAGADFGGGVFLCFPGRRLPGPGAYPLVPFPDSLRGTAIPSAPFVVYRRGLLFNMTSTEGQVTLVAVSDTLVTGRVETTLEGTGAATGGLVERGTLRAEGDFRAQPDGAGFILGL